MNVKKKKLWVCRKARVAEEVVGVGLGGCFWRLLYFSLYFPDRQSEL